MTDSVLRDDRRQPFSICKACIWVATNIGTETTTEVSGFIYELGFGLSDIYIMLQGWRIGKIGKCHSTHNEHSIVKR